MSEDPIHAETVRATLARFQLGSSTDGETSGAAYHFQEIMGVDTAGRTAELVWRTDAGEAARRVGAVGEEAAQVATGQLRGVDSIVTEPSLERCSPLFILRFAPQPGSLTLVWFAGCLVHWRRTTPWGPTYAWSGQKESGSRPW